MLSVTRRRLCVSSISARQSCCRLRDSVLILSRWKAEKTTLLELQNRLSKSLSELFKLEARLQLNEGERAHFRASRLSLGGAKILLLTEVDAIVPDDKSWFNGRGRSLSSAKTSRAVSDYIGTIMPSIAGNDPLLGDDNAAIKETTAFITVIANDEDSEDEEAMRKMEQVLREKFGITFDRDNRLNIASEAGSFVPNILEQYRSETTILGAQGHLFPNFKVHRIRVVNRGLSTGTEPTVELLVRQGNRPKLATIAPSLYFGGAKMLAFRHRRWHFLTAVETLETKDILVEFEDSNKEGLGRLVLVLFKWFISFLKVLNDLEEGIQPPAAAKFCALFEPGFGGE